DPAPGSMEVEGDSGGSECPTLHPTPCAVKTAQGARTEVCRAEKRRRARDVSRARPGGTLGGARGSERQVVVVAEGRGLEVVVVAARGRLPARGSALTRAAARRAAPGAEAGIPAPSEVTPRAALAPREHDHVVGADLGDVARVPLLVLVGAVLDRPLDVDPVALLEEALGDPRQTVLVRGEPPGDDPVPLRLLLLLPV